MIGRGGLVDLSLDGTSKSVRSKAKWHLFLIYSCSHIPANGGLFLILFGSVAIYMYILSIANCDLLPKQWYVDYIEIPLERELTEGSVDQLSKTESFNAFSFFQDWIGCKISLHLNLNAFIHCCITVVL